jgi:hypothetical protein
VFKKPCKSVFFCCVDSNCNFNLKMISTSDFHSCSPDFITSTDSAVDFVAGVANTCKEVLGSIFGILQQIS